MRDVVVSRRNKRVARELVHIYPLDEDVVYPMRLVKMETRRSNGPKLDLIATHTLY
jgi:hypothetical protein